MLSRIEDFTKENIIRDKTGVEGGYVNNPRDRGGETNHGITIAVAQKNRADLVAKFRWDGSMRNLTKEMAFWIYEKDYWKPMYLDDVILHHPVVADKMFDVGINAGPTTVVKHLQQLLNLNNRMGKLYPDIKVDGWMGPTSIRTLGYYRDRRGLEGMRRLIIMLTCLQGAHYATITDRREENEEFFYGWTGRIERDWMNYAEVLRQEIKLK